MNTKSLNNITLTWNSLTIKVNKRSLAHKCLPLNKKPNCEIILEDLKGIAEPGELLAIMGPRYFTETTHLEY